LREAPVVEVVGAVAAHVQHQPAVAGVRPQRVGLVPVFVGSRLLVGAVLPELFKRTKPLVRLAPEQFVARTHQVLHGNLLVNVKINLRFKPHHRFLVWRRRRAT
jgi:hypothetical protein